MVNPNIQQVFLLSDYIGKLGNLLGEFIDFNKGNLNSEDRNSLYDSQIELARLAGEINITGVNLVFDNLQLVLAELDKVTNGMKESVKKALAVENAIQIAAELITIGTAVVSNNPKAFIDSTVSLSKLFKAKP